MCGDPPCQETLPRESIGPGLSELRTWNRNAHASGAVLIPSMYMRREHDETSLHIFRTGSGVHALCHNTLWFEDSAARRKRRLQKHVYLFPADRLRHDRTSGKDVNPVDPCTCHGGVMRRMQETQETNALAVWIDEWTQTAANVDEGMHLLPPVRHLVNTTWRAVPAPSPTLVWGLDLDQVRKHAASVNARAADAEWQRLHTGIMSSALPRFPKQRVAHRYCHAAGMCICKGRGLKLRRCHTRFQNHMKGMFDDRIYEKVLVSEGFVILELISSAPGGDGDNMPEVTTSVPLTRGFYHLSLQYYKPIRSTFASMRMVEEGVPQLGGSMFECEIDGPTQNAEADPTVHPPFLTWWQLLSEYDLRKQLTIRFWQVVDSERALNRDVRPCVVEARLLADTAVVMWKGSMQEKPTRRRRRDHVAIADEAAGESEDDGVDLEAELLEQMEADEVGSDGAESMNDHAFFSGGESDHAEEVAESDADDECSQVASSSRLSTLSGLTYDSDDYCSVMTADSDEYASGLSDCNSNPPSPGEAGDSDATSIAEELPSRASAVAARADADRSERQAQPGLDVYDGGTLIATHALKFNPSNNEFYIKCPNPLHQRCVLTRVAHGGRRRAQGRPLGALAAWLVGGMPLESREAHRAFKPTLEARRRARRDLHRPEQAELLSEFEGKERPRYDSEGTEPEDMP